MNPSTTEALALRLDRIERENAYLRWVGTALFVGIVLLVTVVPIGRSAYRSHKFELKDDQGRIRATLGFARDGSPALEFFDDHGERQVALVAEENDSNLQLHQRGQMRVLLSATSEGVSTLHLFDRGGSSPSSFYMWPEGTTGLFL